MARLGPNPFAKTSAKKGVNPAINVTPLVDVVLVLLIIFMVVMPSMQDYKTIDMVEVKAEGDAKDDGTEPIALTVVTEKGGKDVYAIDKKDVTREQAIEVISRAMQNDSSTRILLRVDSKVKYRVVRTLIKDLREVDVQALSLAVGGKSEEWSEDAEGGGAAEGAADAPAAEGANAREDGN